MRPHAGTARRVLAVPIAVFLVTVGAPIAAQRPSPAPIATVDGVAIHDEDVDKLVGSTVWPLEDRIYRIRKQAVEALIKQRLLQREAERRKVSLQSLIDTEVTAKIEPVTDADIDRAKAANPSASADDLRKQLSKERSGAALTKFVASLESKSAIRVSLDAPRAPQAMLEPPNAPSRGPAAAPITIVEFTDFHCPHCREAEAILKQVLARYPARLVHRDLPLDTAHPQARAAHEAARCADAQGRFWTYRDAMFAAGPKAGAELKAVARETGLDVDTFDRCVAAGGGRAAIDRDGADARRLGVTTTPTFFINGRELEGPATLDAFTSAIRSGLPRPSRSK